MTEDIQKLDKVSDIKTCEVCKCLTCQSGKMFNSAYLIKWTNDCADDVSDLYIGIR